MTGHATPSTPAPSSSPASFHTAETDSPSSGDATTGDATSIISPAEGLTKLPYRPAKQLPHELKEYCRIHLEERLFGSAIYLLDSLLCAGGARKPSTTPRPAFVPPPAQISLLSTLAIHPSHTSFSDDPAEHQISSHALQYLRNLCATVGPVEANLRAAFEFRGRTPRHGRREATAQDSDGEYDPDDDRVGGGLANELAIWSSAPDFWAILGWAFHCSAAHPLRWRYWKAWLECIVEAIEADWAERLRLDEKRRHAGAGNDGGHTLLHDSILMSYVDTLRKERKNSLREIFRALFAFADGTAVDGTVYREVFSHDTVAPSKNKRKRAPTLDLERDQFGDYLDDDFRCPSQDEGPSVSPKIAASRRGRTVKKEAAPAPAAASPGMAESVHIRLRLFALLSSACHHLPEPFASLDDLYDGFATSLRGLPLSTFRLYIESHSTPLSDEVYIFLLRYVIQTLLPTHPDPASVDPDMEAKGGVSIEMLEHCFLPFPSNRIFVQDNAKLSLVLEHMFRSLFTLRDINYSPTLRSAVEKGILARRERTKSKSGVRKKTADPAEDFAAGVLEDSSENLMILLDAMEVSDSPTGRRKMTPGSVARGR